MSKMNENPIVKKSFDLALEIIDFSTALRKDKLYDLAGQVFRCGTSIGANIREAQGAESRLDFIHKMKISFKESEELTYWLELCEQSQQLPKPNERSKKLLLEVRKLLSKIISTSKKKITLKKLTN